MMMNYKLPSFFRKIQSRSNLASYLVITAMMTCISITFIQVAFWFTADIPGFHWGYIPFLAVIVSLESIFTRPVARELEGREIIIYHLAEWVTIAVLLKVAYYLVRGFGQIQVDLPLWQEDFISFFQGEYFFALLIMAAVWLISHVSANDIEALNVDTSDSYWDIGKLMNTRGSIRQDLVSRLLWIGIFLVLMVTVVRASIIAAPGSMSSQAPVINIMIYFALALLLFSQTQFAILRGRWFWHKTPISRFLTGAWIRYSLLFFGLLAIVSFLLPTNYSMGLLETLHAFFSLLINLVIALVQLLILPILWLLTLAGFSRQAQTDITATPAPLPVLPPPVSPNTPLPWLQLIQSILFWVLLIGIMSYALVQFSRQNSQILAFIQNIRIFRYFFSLWNWIINWAVSASKKIGSALDQIQTRLTPKRDTGPSLIRRDKNWVNFRQLTPRQQIIFYYLRLLDRGGEHGIRRKLHETPSQYASALESKLPEVKEDISGITEAFLEARYSAHPIQVEKTTIAQRFWRNITRSLNRLRKPESNPKKF
jgi:hypothetical protein